MQKQDKAKEKKKLSPEEYRSTLKDLEISSISLKKVSHRLMIVLK
jgi:hypothetical protein